MGVEHAGTAPARSSPPTSQSRAVVVFSDRTEIAWLRCLAQGFRHCFVIVEEAPDWILIDPLSNYVRVSTIRETSGEALASWYSGQGYTVISTYRRLPVHEPAPFAPCTCVEIVKRALCIQARWIHTPRQLFNFLLYDKNP